MCKVADLPFPPAHRERLARDMDADEQHQFLGHSKDGRMHIFKVELEGCIKLAENGMDWKPTADADIDAITGPVTHPITGPATHPITDADTDPITDTDTDPITDQ